MEILRPRPSQQSVLSTSSVVPSRVEQAIINSTAPLSLPENEVIEVAGHRGVWANKEEVLNWKGPAPISQYKINYDPSPEVVRKTFNQPIEYNQDISVKYLRPPTPNAGDIVIRQENRQVSVPAPPTVLRVPGERPVTPPPVIVREAPPEYERLERKEIVVSGKEVTHLPDRKLVIEKLPSLPPKPPQIIIEKWLPPTRLRRRVVLDSTSSRFCAQPTRNLIVQWESPTPTVKRGIRYLGVETVNPLQYRSRYGNSLRHPSEMPRFVLDYERIQKLGNQPVYTGDIPDIDLNPQRSLVSSSYRGERLPTLEPARVELYGDLEALRLLDHATLEREGLTQYLNNASRSTTEVKQYIADPLGPTWSYKSSV